MNHMLFLGFLKYSIILPWQLCSWCCWSRQYPHIEKWAAWSAYEAILKWDPPAGSWEQDWQIWSSFQASTGRSTVSLKYNQFIYNPQIENLHTILWHRMSISCRAHVLVIHIIGLGVHQWEAIPKKCQNNQIFGFLCVDTHNGGASMMSTTKPWHQLYVLDTWQYEAYLWSMIMGMLFWSWMPKIILIPQVCFSSLWCGIQRPGNYQRQGGVLLHDLMQRFHQHRRCHWLAYQTLKNSVVISWNLVVWADTGSLSKTWSIQMQHSLHCCWRRVWESFRVAMNFPVCCIFSILVLRVVLLIYVLCTVQKQCDFLLLTA